MREGRVGRSVSILDFCKNQVQLVMPCRDGRNWGCWLDRWETARCRRTSTIDAGNKTSNEYSSVHIIMRVLIQL